MPYAKGPKEMTKKIVNWKLWDELGLFTLDVAAALLCEEDPNSQPSPVRLAMRSFLEKELIAWFSSFDEMSSYNGVRSSLGPGQPLPDDILYDKGPFIWIAEEHEWSPKFLYPEFRKPNINNSTAQCKLPDKFSLYWIQENHKLAVEPDVKVKLPQIPRKSKHTKYKDQFIEVGVKILLTSIRNNDPWLQNIDLEERIIEIIGQDSKSPKRQTKNWITEIRTLANCKSSRGNKAKPK
ncbi:MAG: hypothetical protein OEZ04_04515 [Nitrospinota bacterium]|nr:hypothetical protein [Nitrospinota bacterium]